MNYYSMDSFEHPPELPPLTREVEIDQLLKKSCDPANKLYEFFILYCSRGVDGKALPDVIFAEELKCTLMQEELMNGKTVDVASSSEVNENTQQVLTSMSKSLVILIVFSEAALQTFAGDAHGFRQNNYLLYLQFALKLHDACGARVLGLNMVAVEEEESGRSFVKFQGWCVRFSDVPHYSSWIQDNIAKSMTRIFSLQGVNIDIEDWEYKVPTLFSSLYSIQDEIYSTRWTSTIRIIPWQAVWGYLVSFALGFAFACCGLCCVCCSNCCSNKPDIQKKAHSNASLFGMGMSLCLIGTCLVAYTISARTQDKMCTSQVDCEIYVQSGSFWSYWDEYGEECSCYTSRNPYQWNPEFSLNCSICVCDKIFALHKPPWAYTQLDCSGSSDSSLTSLIVATFATGFMSLVFSLASLNKQALVGKGEIKVVTKRAGLVKENAVFNLQANNNV